MLYVNTLSVNSPVKKGTFDYCAPEVLIAYRQNQIPLAQTSMDMFSLGRVIQWMSSSDDVFWPGIPDMAANEEKEQFLLSDAEIRVEESQIEHQPTKNLVNSLINKNPEERLSTERIKNSSFLRMNIDTTSLSFKVE